MRGRMATGAAHEEGGPKTQEWGLRRACPAAAPENRHRVSNVERRRVFTIMQDSRNMDLSDLSGMKNVAADLLPTKKSERNWGIYSYFAT